MIGLVRNLGIGGTNALKGSVPPMPTTARAITPRTGAIFLAWIFSAWTAYVFLLNPHVAALPHPFSAIAAEAMRFAIFGAPAIWLAMREGGRGWREVLGFSGGKPGALRTGLLVAVIYGVILSALAYWGYGRAFSPLSIPFSFWFTAFSASVMSEEIAFRGLLFRAFASWPRSVTVVVSSAMFMAIHFPGWYRQGAFPTPSAWIAISVSIFLIGCVAGVLYLKTRSIWGAAAVHAMNNLVAAVFR